MLQPTKGYSARNSGPADKLIPRTQHRSQEVQRTVHCRFMEPQWCLNQPWQLTKSLTCWLVEMHSFEIIRPIDWSRSIFWKNQTYWLGIMHFKKKTPDRLIGQDAFFFHRTCPADWSRCILLIEPDLLIGREEFFWKNLTSWLVEMHRFKRTWPANWSR